MDENPLTDPVDDFFNFRQRARQSAVINIETNPDEAARAMQLGQNTGTPPEIVAADMPSFERDSRATMAGEIINNNPALIEYINSTPIAAQISNDDYGNLDNISERIKPFIPARGGRFGALIGAFSPEGRLGEALRRGFGEGNYLEWAQRTDTDKALLEQLRRQPGWAPILASATAIEAFFRSFGAALHGFHEVGTTTLTPVMSQIVQPGRNPRDEASALMRDVTGIAEYLMNYQGHTIGTRMTNVPLRRQVEQVMQDSRPFLEAGQEPPPRVNPQMDQLKALQAQIELDMLKELQREAQASTTRERSPEMFSQFVRLQQPGDIYISFDAIQKMYGEKLPEVGDNLLGWVPNMNQQWNIALATGGDIRVPMAEWLARVDPQIANELHENIRVRRNGVTLEEAKTLKEATVAGDTPEYMALHREQQGIREQIAELNRRANEAQDRGDVIERNRLFDQVDQLKEQDKDVERRMEEYSIRSKEAKASADIEVFHGSPHSFDAFSMEKIGTGEGAQSYGHGLYFAESQQVAKSYAVGRQTGGRFTVNDPTFGDISMMEVKPPSMYRARIRANPEDFLDWDRPFSEQPLNVQEALMRLGEGNEEFAQRAGIGDKTGQTLYGALGRGVTANRLTGVGQVGERADAAASKALREAGIPGIRYLDQGSRNREIPSELISALEEINSQMDAIRVRPVDEMTQSVMSQFDMFERQRQDILKEIKQFKEENRTYNYVLFDDSLVEVLDRNGQAVEAVRKQAGLTPLAEIGDVQARTRPGETRQYGAGVEAVIPDRMTPAENMIWQAFDETLGKYIPGFVETQAATGLKVEGRTVRGSFVSYHDRLPIILFALKGKDVIGTARHEAIHALRHLGFFTEVEWATLRRAALEEKWFYKQRTGEGSSILDRYAGMFNEGDTARLNDLDLRRDRGPEYQELKKRQDEAMDRFLEEAIADEFKYWNHTAENPTIAHKVFEKLREFLEKVKSVFVELRTKDPEVAKIFEAIEAGEIGGRKPTGVTEAMTAAEREPKQLELDVTRQNDKAIFDKASAIGMTVDQYKRYIKKIQERNAEDILAQRERAQRLEKKSQTAEWKQESIEITPEVTRDLLNRPDIAAQAFFRYGELYGEKMESRPRINPEFLTDLQKSVLPETWLSEKGMHPDDAAGLFGYQTGSEMIVRIAEFEAARGKMRPGEFFDRMVKAEVERRMVAKYGELDKNILAAAEDHVLGQTQMDLLHEETVALGMKSKAEISFSKEEVKGWIQQEIGQTVASAMDSGHFLNTAGKAGKLAEIALLKGDFTEAFKQKQRQYYAVLAAREAKAFEKEVASFDRIADRFSKREVSGVDQVYTDFIQRLLLQADYPVRRSMAEVNDNIGRSGFDSFDSFVTSKAGDGWELAVEGYIRDGQILPSERMTVEQAREFHTAIKSLLHAGREENKIILAGEARDFMEFKTEVVYNIKSMPLRDKNKPSRWWYKFDAMHVRMEEIMKDLDLREQAGPLFNAIIRPMAEAKHQEYTLLEKLSKRLTDIRQEGGKQWRRSLKDTIPNDFLIDPVDGTFFDMTREHMINLMAQFGNRSNMEKTVLGYFGKAKAVEGEAKLRRMFDQHATKQDWDFVQNMWNVFEEWRPQIEELYYKVSGVPPKFIEFTPIDTPHGRFAGGYFPVIFDEYRSNINAVRAKNQIADSVFGQNYFRSTPANAYTKARTGYIDYIQFQNSIEQVAARMQQMVHDLAYREPIMQVNKILKDRDIRQAIRHHYGIEYEAQLEPWLKKMASHFSFDEQAVGAMNNILRKARFNLIGHALPLNLKVLLSPDVATGNVFNWANTAWNAEANVKLAHEKSKEIPHTFRNMDRDFRERLEATIVAKGWSGFQADAVRAAFWPMVKLSQGLRINTFVVEYNKALARGMDDGSASAHADSLVRERHGSAGLPDLPAIMTSNEAMKTYTMFYGFFSTMYNWQRQIPGQVRRHEWKDAFKTLWGSVLIPAGFGALLFNQAREDDSWWKTAAKAMVLQPMSTMVLARDIGNLFIEGFPSRSPVASIVTSYKSLSTDVENYMKGRRVKKPITHAANVVGLTTGLPMAQIGRTSQFVYDVNTARQRPRNIQEWLRGVIHGEARLKK